MSDDKIIVQLALDEASVQESLDYVSNKTRESFSATRINTEQLNKQINLLSTSVESFNVSLDEMSRSASYSNVQLTTLSYAASSSSSTFEAFSGSVESVSESVFVFYNNITKFRDVLIELPSNINKTADSFQFFIKLFSDLIRFTELSNVAFFSNLINPLKQLDKSIDENQEKMNSSLNIYSKFVSIRESISNAFHIISVSIGLATKALAAYLLYFGIMSFKTGKNVLDEYISLFTKFGSSAVNAFNMIKTSFTGMISTVISGFRNIRSDISSVLNLYKESGKSLFYFIDTLLALTGKLSAITILSSVFSGNLEGIDGILSGVTTKTLLFATAISGLFTLGLITAINAVADFAYNLGTKLVNSFRASYEEFIKFRKETLQFEETIKAFQLATNGASGSTDEWNLSINRISKSLNFTVGELRKSSAELVAVGTRLGYTKEQTDKLLQVISEFAVISGKDLFQATLDFTSALQGNAQAVLSYGVKMTAASNANYAFKHGITKSFEQMTEVEKQQVRYNNLLSQYATVQGIANKISDDWFSQTKKLEVTQNRLNTQIGLGAAYVEDINLVAGLWNNILSLVSDEFARLFGFLGAFGSRVMQVTGIIISFSFKAFLLYRSLQLLDILLKSNSWLSFANKTLPIINTSLVNLLKTAGLVNVELTGLSSTFKTFSNAIKLNLPAIFSWITGVGSASGAVNLFSIVMSRISGALRLFAAGFSAILIPLLPLIAKFALISAAFYGLFSILKKINDESNFFTNILTAVEDILVSVAKLAVSTGTVLSGFFSTVKRLTGQTLGFVVSLFVDTFAGISSVMADATSFFSKKTSDSFRKSSIALVDYQKKLASANLDIFNTGEIALASAQKVEKATFDYEDFVKVVNDLKQDSEIKPEKISNEYKKRLDVIKGALAAEVSSQKEANNLMALARQDAMKKTNEIIAQEIGAAGQTLLQKETDTYNKRIVTINSLLANGLINEKRHSDLKKQILDDYNNKLDESNNKQLSNAEIVMQAFNISAKAAERAIEITNEVVQSKINLISGAFQRLGASLVNGGEAWSDFASFAYDTIGTLLIQIGIAVMGIAAAVEAVVVSLSTLNPVMAFIAGAALVAAGGALKALAKKSAPEGSGYAGGGMVSSPTTGGSYPKEELTPRPTQDRQDPGKSVVINISGSLISTEQTSKTLINMIAKEFDKTGADIRRRSFA